MTHGLQILTALREEMRRLGRKPSDVESAAVIDAYLEMNEVKLKRLRKNMPKPRARDAVFDLLAKLDGQDVAQLTRHAGSRIAGAKKQILDVLPDMTTDLVIAEINRRWEAWCRRFPDKRMQTVMALVSHWAELGGGKKTEREELDVYREPDFDWKSVLREKFAGTPFVEELNQKTWSDVPLDIRRKMLVERRAVA